MNARRVTAGSLVAALLFVGPGGTRRTPAGGPTTLAVWSGGSWRPFWRSDASPDRWVRPDSTLAGALSWRRLAPGLEWAGVRLACPAPVWRARLVVARLDPGALTFTLEMDLTLAERLPDWSIDRAPGDAVLAVNAGQFAHAMPWGWVVIGGRERLGAGTGPLTSAVWVDSAGDVHWTHGRVPRSASGVVTGFQSYPTLLAGDGTVPPALRASGAGVNLTHRDARLALGGLRDGRLLLVMTRYDAFGEIANGMPLGPTTPEMAAIMGALGASDAVMLDGGISAQLLLRDPARGEVLRWPGMRHVPLALIARPRRG